MKKPFKDRTIGKILLNKWVKKGLSSIPLAGPIFQNLLDENSTPVGVIDSTELKPQIAAIILSIIVALVLFGVIDWEQAEQTKDFIFE